MQCNESTHCETVLRVIVYSVRIGLPQPFHKGHSSASVSRTCFVVRVRRSRRCSIWWAISCARVENSLAGCVPEGSVIFSPWDRPFARNLVGIIQRDGLVKLFPVTCLSGTRVGTLKLVEADEEYRQNRDFSPHHYGRGSAFDGMHAAIKRHDSAGKGLLPAHGSPLWRSHHAVFALLLQDGRFA